MASGSRKKQETASPDGKDDRLALGLAQGMTRSEAAQYAGVGERTVYSKLRDPSFLALVNRIRDRLVNETVGKLAASGAPAITRLKGLIESDDEGIALQAAKSIIMLLVKLGTYNDISNRLSELESRVGSQGRQENRRPRLEIPHHDARWDEGSGG